MNTPRETTIRPGLLVSLSSKVTGNVSYEKQDIEAETRLPDGSLRAQWETTKRVEDADEHEAAIKIRSKCRSLITGICAKSNFGLLCPEEKAGLLWERYKEALDLAAEFNSTSRLTTVAVYIIAGRVAQDDVSAVRAINSEVRELLATMEDGLKRLDVSVVRDAANRAKEIGAMLSPDAKSRIEEAISVARSAARRIVKAAEEGAAEIDQATLTKIRQSRAGFLDLEDAAEVAIPEPQGRAIDLEPQALILEHSEPVPATPDVKAALAARFGAERVQRLADEVAGSEERIADAIEQAAGENDHPTLCQCAECEALYGEAVRAPVPAARSIELD